MTKEQFLAMSLPYDVKAIDKFKCIWTIHPYKDALDTLTDNEHLSYENFIKEDGHKLVLRHLSDLTKEIEHKGERFVPIVELAKMEELLEPISFNTMDDFSRGQRGVCAHDRFNNQWLMFSFDCGFSSWHKPHEAPEHRPTLLNGNQLDLFQKLIEWHFDIFGGIDNGDAIDVNTLDKNPYA